MGARLIQVIEVDELRGRGIEADPYRRVTVYYSPDGDWLAERDHHVYARDLSRGSDHA
jgi:hypothetical protein